jgi:CDP-glucose 4,6-dehydratase
LINLSSLTELAGRSVFLTGHTGFKGSWLAVWLHQLGARVTGFALKPPGTPNNFDASHVEALLLRHCEGDIRDLPALAQAMDGADPDVVLHLAAQPIVRESYAAPRDTFETNFMGTCNVLECVRRRAKPCVVVVVTSDKCYENREQVWGYCERDAMGGHDPYSASKGAAELLVSSYRRSFFPADQGHRHGVKLASARAGNVIGGGDWARDRIVPDIVRHLASRRPVPVRSPQAVRPWQHVLEPLGGYLTLAAQMLASDDPGLCDGWNFGPAIEGDASVRDLVEAFCAAWGQGRWEDQSDPAHPHEANTLRLSIEKAVTRLNWRPVWTFQETIRRTANWYHEFYTHPQGGMYRACLGDLAAYLDAAKLAAVAHDRNPHHTPGRFEAGQPIREPSSIP